MNINELRIDQPGTDNDEFFELFGEAGAPLDGLSYVVLGDGSGGSGVVEEVIDLTGQTLDENGFFVAAESTFSLGTPDLTTTLNFENSDNVTHLLVSDFTGSEGDDLDTNDDGELDILPFTEVIDGVALIEEANPPTGTEFEFATSLGLPTVGPDGSFVPGHVFRDPDGTGDFNIGAFDPVGGDDTPGTSNSGDGGGGVVLTTIPEIQGAGHISPLVDQSVTTSGIITAIAFNGYYLQDPTGDGDDDTSDGIFVFGSTDSLSVGDEVTLEGTVAEFIPGGAGTGNLSTTQIAATSTIINSSGNALPDAVVIGQSGRLPSNTIVLSDDELPVNLQDAADDAANNFDPAEDAIDFFESLEGQLVTVEDAVAVSPTRVFSSFSAEAFTLPNQGAVSDDPLNARGGISLDSGLDNTGDQNPERVQIQFDPTISGEDTPPALNVGDELGDVTGVLGYNFGNFEVNVTGPVNVVTPGGLEQQTTELVGSDDQLTVASYNVLNLTSAAAVEDAEADPDATQRELLAAQIVNNLAAPDIIALQEIQDNDGVEGGSNSLVSDASQTLADLVAAIEAAGGPSYEFFDVFEGTDAAEFTELQGGVPSGNIRNAFLYNPERVTLENVDALTPTALTEAGVSNPDAFAGSRVPLVGTFGFNGESVTVVNNHFSSRFGSTPIFGGVQPFVQAGEEAREAQSLAINEFVDSLLAEESEANIIVAGDLNTFQFTDDLAEILPGVGDEQVLTNLVPQAETAGDAATFIFDGNSQVLDHTFVSDSLVDSAEFDIVRVNTEFTRDDNALEFDDTVVASDHEPLVTRLDIPEENFTLQFLHASDLEGGVEAIERAPNFAAIANYFATESEFAENTLTVSAGDNFLSGPFFSAAGDTSGDAGIEAALGEAYEFLFDLAPGTLFGDGAPNEIETDSGRVDIAIANLIGFDASVVGNHEFDLGTFELADIIGTEVAGGFGANGILNELENPGALFPFLSANLDFSNDSQLAFLATDELLTTDDFNLIEQIDTLDAIVAAAGGDESVLRPDPAEGNDDFIDFDRIAPSVIADVNGEQVGIIGLTTPELASLTSNGGVEVLGTEGAPNPDTPEGQAILAELAEIANEQVDLLQEQGVEIIVLASHLQQFSFEEALAPLVSGVDIFLAGGSDFILLDENDEPFGSDEADGPYPVLTQNADGDAAVLLSTNGEYSYVGRLVVEFDENGVLLADTIDSVVSGAFRTTDQGVIDVLGEDNAAIASIENLEDITADPANEIGNITFVQDTVPGQVQNLVSTVEAVVESQDSNIAGFTDVFLNGIRDEVRNEETNLGNLSADANLFLAQQFDETVQVSLQNAGGIRIQIGDLVSEAGSSESQFLPPQANEFRPEGAVSQLAISDVFRFDNSLTLQTITLRDLVDQLENGVELSDPDFSNEPGQFPQIAGVNFSFDPTLPQGSRIQSAALVDDEGNPTTVLVEDGEFVADPDAPVRVVINEFLAGLLGEGIDEPDGFTFEGLAVADPEFANVINLEDLPAPENFNQIEFEGATVNGQVDAFAEFLAEFHDTPETAFDIEDTPVEDDLRIQNLAFREDTVLDNVIDTADFSDSETAVIASIDQNSAQTNGANLVFATEGSDTAEIVVFDEVSQQFFIAGGEFIDVLSGSGDLIASIQVETEVTSVAVGGGFLAASVPADPETEPGSILLFEIDGLSSDSAPIQTFEVGALPDSLTFTPDGSTIIVANEGEADIEESEGPDGEDVFTLGEGGDPEGSISVIDLATSTVTTVGFTDFNDQQAALEADGVVFIGQPDLPVGSGTTVAQDLEPEFVSVAPDGNTAFVTLQENNAIAIVDLSGATPSITDIVGLGSQDLSLPENALDANDEDEVFNPGTIENAVALFQPDAIASFTLEGQTFFATANEGDGRDFDVFDLDDTTLDPADFTDPDALQDNDTGVGDLEVSQVLGDTDGDGVLDQIVAFGGRSFSILDEEGNTVFDSGNLIETLVGNSFPLFFNDARSDDAGPEPEAVTFAEVNGQPTLFVGLERSAGVLAFTLALDDGEIEADFAGFITVPVPGGFPLTEDLDDITAPEGLIVLPAAISPTGQDLIVISDEEQNQTFGFNLNLDASSSTQLDGIENLIGSSFEDILVGDENDNVLFGAGRSDTLNGLEGNDTLIGGGRDDLLITGLGLDNLQGRAGVDTADFSNAETGVIVDLDVFSSEASGSPSPDIPAQQGALFDALRTEGGRKLADVDNVENLIGSDFGDVLFGNNEDNLLEGGNGDDTIHGFAGDDTLDGGDGSDTVVFTGFQTGVEVDLSAETATGGLGDIVVLNFENVNGSLNNDTIAGDSGDNILFGNAGDDLLTGNGGDDTLDGGEGFDTAVFSGLQSDFILSADGVNTILAGAGFTTSLISIEALQFDDGVFENVPPERVTVEGTPGDDLIFSNDGSNFNGIEDTVFTGAGDDEVDLGLGDPSVTGGNRINTGSGDDVIVVSTGDRVSAGSGNDLLDAELSGGNNRLSGGSGNDVFTLGGDGDRALGGVGQDGFEILASATNNIVSGGADADTFSFLPNGESVTQDLNHLIVDFEVGTDVLSFGIGLVAEDILVEAAGGDSTLAIAGFNAATFSGVLQSDLQNAVASAFA